MTEPSTGAGGTAVGMGEAERRTIWTVTSVAFTGIPDTEAFVDEQQAAARFAELETAVTARELACVRREAFELEFSFGLVALR